MKKKINFRQIEVRDLDNIITNFDISKELGNAIYVKTADLGELELAREIYSKGEVEIDEVQANTLSQYVRENFLAIIQEAVCPLLENLHGKKNDENIE